MTANKLARIHRNATEIWNASRHELGRKEVANLAANIINEAAAILHSEHPEVAKEMNIGPYLTIAIR